MTEADRTADPIGRLRLPPARAVALARLWPILPGARPVGGAVRDMLAGEPVADIDLATPDPPETVRDRLGASGLKVVPTGLAHGTVTAVVDGVPFEVTTLRRDLATDGRHATVAFTDDWRADAARRDFTFNAMSLDRAGTVHDFFDGAADLAARRVRFVGDPALRIGEDHLRILRFFRFLARFGDAGDPDRAALEAIGARPGLVETLAAERVWAELRRLLGTPAPGQALAAMRRTGVLGVLFGADATPDRLDALLRTGAPAVPLLRLAALTREAPDRLARRLRLSGVDADRLAGAAAPIGPLDPEADDAALRRALADHAPTALLDRACLAAADDAIAGRARDWASLRARIGRIAPPVFPLAGRDALALGASPGPAVGAALARVRAWWLARGAADDRAACLGRLAAELAAPAGDRPGQLGDATLPPDPSRC